MNDSQWHQFQSIELRIDIVIVSVFTIPDYKPTNGARLT